MCSQWPTVTEGLYSVPPGLAVRFVLSNCHDTTAAIKRFTDFCQKYDISNPFPLTQSALCYFVAYLGRAGLAPTTVKVYLSALRRQQIERELPAPDHANMPKLGAVQGGAAKVHALSTSTERVRLPITPDILRAIKGIWAETALQYNTIMCWAIASMAFFVFFRLGELLVEPGVTFDPARHLSGSDVAVDSRDTPTLLKVHLKTFKTDQLRKGVDIFIGKTGDELCPLAAVLAFMAVCGQRHGPLFRLQTGDHCTKEFFVEKLRLALRRAGLNPADYAGHSFRIGAATMAAERGIPDSTIKALGRWRSSAFLSYIRNSRDSLAQASSILSIPPPSADTH